MDLEKLDKTYHLIMLKMIETGVAPHYTEVAKELGVTPEEGRQAVHALFNSGIRVPGWMYPNTDFIASFAPFNSQPTQFKVTVDGEQKWYAQ